VPPVLQATECAAAAQLSRAPVVELGSELGKQLVRVGEALCAQLPVPLCCNNPGCLQLFGASEQQLVEGKGSVCSTCRWVAGCAVVDHDYVGCVTQTCLPGTGPVTGLTADIML
jgi:hypothetical protein